MKKAQSDTTNKLILGRYSVYYVHHVSLACSMLIFGSYTLQKLVLKLDS